MSIFMHNWAQLLLFFYDEKISKICELWNIVLHVLVKKFTCVTD